MEYITAVSEGDYKSEFELTKRIPYLTLTGKLWAVPERILKKIDSVITAPHYMCHWTGTWSSIVRVMGYGLFIGSLLPDCHGSQDNVFKNGVCRLKATLDGPYI